jgi:hypothetical protein
MGEKSSKITVDDVLNTESGGAQTATATAEFTAPQKFESVTKKSTSCKDLVGLRLELVRLIGANKDFAQVLCETNHAHLLDFANYQDDSMKCDEHFVHLLIVSLTLISCIKNRKSSSCKICANPKNFHKEFILKIFLNKNFVVTTLSAFFSVPTTLTKTVLAYYKPTVTTSSGMFAFDLAQTLTSRLQHLYFCEMRRAVDYVFLGFVFRQSPSLAKHELVASAARIAANNSAVRPEVLCGEPPPPTDAVLILYGTGSPLSPAHWCAVFLDLNTLTCFFYNSLADKEHFDGELFSIFTNSFGKKFAHSLRVVTNEHRQQFDNNLCGIFAVQFLTSMLECPSAFRRSHFEDNFNCAKNRDQEIFETTQKKFLMPATAQELYPFFLLKDV